ncbi:hypothetical protein RFI_12836 [Reticulomyxa filosa]|uniref:Uncharacterized protein n=1 Tax=Reticulomyxa filosa TaxID=46433 RepID=X6NEC9_RETFI|nr:hypothetical protein RFI_12836 [Reticulomyxa filosa]|eukprot:ETO24321.1 hypothetical protein RFI_12836 [Reticulomyxa filosa]
MHRRLLLRATPCINIRPQYIIFSTRGYETKLNTFEDFEKVAQHFKQKQSAVVTERRQKLMEQLQNEMLEKFSRLKPLWADKNFFQQNATLQEFLREIEIKIHTECQRRLSEQANNNEPLPPDLRTYIDKNLFEMLIIMHEMDWNLKFTSIDKHLNSEPYLADVLHWTRKMSTCSVELNYLKINGLFPIGSLAWSSYETAANAEIDKLKKIIRI